MESNQESADVESVVIVRNKEGQYETSIHSTIKNSFATRIYKLPAASSVRESLTDTYNAISDGAYQAQGTQPGIQSDTQGPDTYIINGWANWFTR